MKMIILTSKLSLFDGIRHPKKTNRILSMYYYIIFLSGGFPIKDVAEQKG